MPANCAEISKVTSGGRNWLLRDLGPPEAKAFDRKYSSCIRLCNTTMEKWFRHHLEKFISFPLIYRFAGIRSVLTELETDNWKHRSNYTVTLNSGALFQQDSDLSGLAWQTVHHPVWQTDCSSPIVAKQSIAQCGKQLNSPFTRQSIVSNCNRGPWWLSMVDLNTLNSWNTSSRTDKIVYIGLVACIADSCKHLKIASQTVHHPVWQTDCSSLLWQNNPSPSVANSWIRRLRDKV